jgi:UDP-N-acetylmuramoyl-tripeptide--D-alanyl-D-alanine ligase
VKLTRKDILTVKHVQTMGFEKAGHFACTGVSTDSRTVHSGDLFIAVHGDTFDGHSFLTKAVEAGAAGLVIDTKWADANPILLSSLNAPRLIVQDTVRALGQLATAYRRRFKIPVLVIGGSNGKTTTKDMVLAALGAKYKVLATEGNLNNHIGVPHTLFQLEKKHQIAVIEIGTNHFGEIAYLCSIIEPTHALVTNVGREHLEFFGSLGGAAKAEGEAFEWLRTNRPKTATGLVNSDDTRLLKKAQGLKKLIPFGFGKHAAVKGRLLSMNESACARLEVKAKGKKPFVVELSVPGKHNAQNALAAATVGLFFRVPAAKILKALSSFTGSSKRLQLVKLDRVTILNDTYNANPDSVMAAFETLRAARTTGKKIAVLADMLELGESALDEHRRIGQAVARYGIEYLLTYGAMAQHIHDAAATKFKAHYDQKNILSEYLAELLTDGDIVLIKGSRGMKMEDVVTFLTERAKGAHGTPEQGA